MKKSIFLFLVFLVYSNYVFAEKPDRHKYLWSEKLGTYERFVLVFNEQAVLDKETGLVWERTPDGRTFNWWDATFFCYNKVIDGRKGWRPPTVEEMTSIIDSTQENPALPEDHPFTGVQNWFYLTSTTDGARFNSVWGVHLGSNTPAPPLSNVHNLSKSDLHRIWAVRGNHGHDAHPQ